MSLAELQRKIDNQTARLAVIGLGYVGTPVACEFARAGFSVTGIESQAERVNSINAGISPIDGMEPGLQALLSEAVQSGKLKATQDYADLRCQDVILICVETPVDDNNIPRYVALQNALIDLAPVLKPGALVIIESTIAPGTMSRVVRPLLEQHSGLKVNQDFFLGNCPERVMPGKLLTNLRTVSRVIGGMSPETAETMAALYRHIVQADLDPVDCITAELVKTVENTYRDVQIAFANEVALICEAVGGDVWRVRELVNKSPGRQMHLPGAGVGGHCIPKDPWLLAYSVRDQGHIPQVISAAREVNNSMPIHMVDMVEEALQAQGLELRHARLLVLGYAYLEDSDDVRNSPSELLVKILRAKGCMIVVHDPFIAEYKGDLLNKAQGCDAAILMVKHQQYLSLDLAALRSVMSTPILVDGRALFANQPAAAGFTYRCLGVTSDST